MALMIEPGVVFQLRWMILPYFLNFPELELVPFLLVHSRNGRVLEPEQGEKIRGREKNNESYQNTNHRLCLLSLSLDTLQVLSLFHFLSLVYEGKKERGRKEKEWMKRREKGSEKKRKKRDGKFKSLVITESVHSHSLSHFLILSLSFSLSFFLSFSLFLLLTSSSSFSPSLTIFCLHHQAD